MSKSKNVFMASTGICLLLFGFAQYKLQTLAYYYETLKGEKNPEGLDFETMIYPTSPYNDGNSSTGFNMRVKNGELQYALDEETYREFKGGYVSNTEIIIKNAVKDVSKLNIVEEEVYRLNGEPVSDPCEVYEYTQDQANVVLKIGEETDYFRSNQGRIIPTGLTLYSTDKKSIIYSERHCKDESGNKSIEVMDNRIDRNSSESVDYLDNEVYSEQQEINYIETKRGLLHISDDVYYAMPSITTNMDGIANIFKLNIEENAEFWVDQPSVREEIVHEIPIERGSVGFLDYYEDYFYTYLWNNGNMSVVQYDASFQEVQRIEFPFILEDLNYIASFETKDILSLVGKNAIYAFDRSTMKLIDQAKSDVYKGVEDVMYKDNQFYMAVNNEEEKWINKTRIFSNPRILIYEGGELIHEGSLNVLKEQRVENETISFDVIHAVRELVHFVREER